MAKMGKLGSLLGGIVGFFTGGPTGALAGAEKGGKIGGVGDAIKEKDPLKAVNTGYGDTNLGEVAGAINKPVTSLVDSMGLFNQSDDEIEMFNRGGVPNDGNPALISDLVTGKKVGVMNENNPELIINPLLEDGQTPQSSQNMQVQPPTRVNQMPTMQNQDEGLASEEALMPYLKQMSGGKEIPGEEKADLSGTGILRFEKKDTGLTGKTNEDIPWGDILRGVGRIVGSYNDSRRARFGLPAGPMTNFLNWVDEREDAGKKTGKDRKGYQTKEIYNSETGTTDLFSFDPESGELGKKLGEKAPSKESGQYTESQEQNLFEEFKFGKRDAMGVSYGGLGEDETLKDVQDRFDVYAVKLEKGSKVYQEMERMKKEREVAIYKKWLEDNELSSSRKNKDRFLKESGR